MKKIFFSVLILFFAFSLLYEYNEKYNTGLGIPLTIFSADDFLIGDNPILKNLHQKLEQKKNNNCLLLNNRDVSFEKLNFNQLPGKVKIWNKDRILIKKSNTQIDSGFLKKLLLETDFNK